MEPYPENPFTDEWLDEWRTTAHFAHPDEREDTILSQLILVIQEAWKMTNEQVLAFRKQHVVKALLYKEENDRKVKEEMRLLRKPENVQTQLITICLDQNEEQEKVIKKQFQIMDKIISARYKWMINGTYNFEYFGKEGWNPHIHIKIDQSIKGATIAQMLRRKLQDNHIVYRVNVITRSAKEHDGYIEGIKTESKQENTHMDRMLRENYNIKDFYKIN